MPQTGYYVAGDWDGQCDECGRGFKFSALSKRWDSAWCCEACWEPRQPQDFVRAVRDDPSVPVARPRTNLPLPGFIWTNAGLPFQWMDAAFPYVWTTSA